MNRRRPTPLIRTLAGITLAAFLLVVISTTVRSVGAYCLTSHGGNTSTLPK